ncbi:MAG: MBL fold metallo-hydrolase, partial [Deltaproteobacteria bacterium]|nr:MBL fold metallo-hydrolase [Deltaproteobacteria bacterium]
GNSLREGIINLYCSDKKQLKPRCIEQCVIDIHDKDEIIDGYRVHHTPGHCSGSICLEVKDFLFAGDHILSKTTPHQSPGAMISGTGLNIYLNSLEKISRLSIEKDLYGLPGHEEDIYPLSERVEAIRRFHEERLKDIERICKEEKSIYDITVGYYNSLQPEIFSRPDYPDYSKLLAILEISAHVEYLIEEKRLRKVDEEGDVIIYTSKTIEGG